MDSWHTSSLKTPLLCDAYHNGDMMILQLLTTISIIYKKCSIYEIE